MEKVGFGLTGMALNQFGPVWPGLDWAVIIALPGLVLIGQSQYFPAWPGLAKVIFVLPNLVWIGQSVLYRMARSGFCTALNEWSGLDKVSQPPPTMT
jgi:hypothetical protein